MDDLDTTVSKLNSSALATLFDLGRETQAQSPEAFQEALEHLLAIPIENALNQLPRELGDKLRHRSASLHVTRAAQTSGINTFGELLRHSHPPVEMLKFAKEFGKTAIVHGKTIWPRSACEVLYYGGYAAGLVRWRERIGTLSKADLQAGFRKLLVRSWLTHELKALLEKAEQQLSASAGKSQVLGCG